MIDYKEEKLLVPGREPNADDFMKRFSLLGNHPSLLPARLPAARQLLKQPLLLEA